MVCLNQLIFKHMKVQSTSETTTNNNKKLTKMETELLQVIDTWPNNIERESLRAATNLENLYQPYIKRNNKK